MKPYTVQSINLTVTTNIRATHRWPDAPEHRWYLSFSHPHLFGITLTIPAKHSEREIEFHDLARMLDYQVWQTVDQTTADLPSFLDKSCETIAQEIASRILTELDLPWCTVEVDEDATYSASVTITASDPHQSH